MMFRIALVSILAVFTFLVQSDQRVEAAKVPGLTFAVPTAFADFILPYIAQANGYWTDAGVRVKLLENVGGIAASSLVVAGRADFTQLGTPSAFFPAFAGKATSIVYNNTGGGVAAMVVARKGTNRLMDLSGKRVGSVGVGGSSFGWASAYSAWVASHGGVKFNIVPFNDPTTLVGALQSGQIDAGVGPKQWFTDGLAAGHFNIIINSESAGNKRWFIGGYAADAVIWGVRANLKSKRESVIRFLMGIARANAWIQSRKNQPEQIAAVVLTQPAFRGVSRAALLDGLKHEAKFWTPFEGKISRGLWEKSLQTFDRWQIQGLDVRRPEASYSQAVDMSYLERALTRIG